MVKCFIGLGSNQGESLALLHSALQQIAQTPGLQLDAVSPVYQTRPVGPADQPDYLNAVAQLHTELSARQLLDTLLQIEQQHGRERNGVRWGPRTLDLDVLLYGEAVIAESGLNVPHPQLCARAFVVYPLLDLAPDLVLPNGCSLRTCQQALGTDPGIRVLGV